MKKYKIMIMLLLIAITVIINTNASYGQKNNDLKYKISKSFTGEVRDGIDSVYSVTCILDRRSLAEARKLYIAMGSQRGAMDLFKISLDSADIVADSQKKLDGVRKNGNVIEIELGEHPAGSQHIEVWTWSRQKNGEGENRGEHKRAIRDEALVIDDEK